MKINQENMNKIVVPEIPLKLLFEINQKLEVIDKQQLNLIEENKQLTPLRDWILPMLMNGQVKEELQGIIYKMLSRRCVNIVLCNWNCI